MSTVGRSFVDRVLSIAVVVAMVSTGFFVFTSFGPVTEEVQGEETSTGAHGSYGDGGRVLIVFDYFYYLANPQDSGNTYYYHWAEAWISAIKADGYEVDEWRCYPFGDSYPYLPGQAIPMPYDSGEYCYNYYPWDSKYGDGGRDMYEYEIIILAGRGNWYYGMYYQHDGGYTNGGATVLRTIEGLKDYMDDGGSVWWVNYYGGYAAYYPSVGSANRAEVQDFYHQYVGITTDYNYNPGYSVRGIDDVTPNWGDDSVGIIPQDGEVFEFLYPENYPYHTYYQEPFDTNAIACYEGSFSYGSWYGRPVGIQRQTAYYQKSLYLMWDPMYLRYRSPPGEYQVSGVAHEGEREIMVRACLNFLVGHDGGMLELDAPSINEVYDEGEPGIDQFVELFNGKRSRTPVDLSPFYLSVVADPRGEEHAYGSYDLVTYDDDGYLDSDEFLVVTSSDYDLASYKRIGVYNKTDNTLTWEISWSHAGKALDPVYGYSTQIPWDMDRNYYLRGQWTLAPTTKGTWNEVSVPDFETSHMVINEVNPGYVELYNTGGSDVYLGGYKLAGPQNLYTIPQGTRIPAGGFFTVSSEELFIASARQGGDMKLLNELDTLIDVITYDPSEGLSNNSIAARHFDGIGHRGSSEQWTARSWEYTEQENAFWEFDVPATKGSRNYEGESILIDGILAFEHLNASESVFKKGIYTARVKNMNCLDSWDIVLFSGILDDRVIPQFTSYLNSGGRLYLESLYFRDVAKRYENFYDLLHIKARDFQEGKIGSDHLEGDLFAGGISLAYDPAAEVSERLDPVEDAFRVMYLEEEPANRFVSAYIENPTTGYRVVSSALEYREMVSWEDVPGDYLDVLLDWFCEENLNNAPFVTLLEGQSGMTPLMDDGDKVNSLGWLGWRNDDPDHWDQENWQTLDEHGHEMYKCIDFTLYLDIDEEKVRDHSEACQVVATGNTTYYRPRDLEPGHYFWTVTAKDRYGVTGEALDEGDEPVVFSFYYDDKPPKLLGIRPYFGPTPTTTTNLGPELLGFYEEHGYHPSFGPEEQGKPYGLLFTAHDADLGLSFHGPEKTELSLEFAHPDPDLNWMTQSLLKAMADIELQTRDGGPIEGAHGENTVQFIMNLPAPEFFLDDDGRMANGRYTFRYELVDFVGNTVEGELRFSMDCDEPDPVTGMAVSALDHPIYLRSGINFLKAGENYLLSGAGPNSSVDPSLERIEFIMADKLYNSREEVLGVFEAGELEADQDPKKYAVEFEAVANYQYFYALSYDRAGNYAKSDILSGVAVDAYAPMKPYNLVITLGDDDFVTVSGWARDSIEMGKTSGMSHVYIYVNGEKVAHRTGGVYSWLEDEPYQAGDEMKVQVISNRFGVEISLDPVRLKHGDVENLIQVQGVDNVGNVGEPSDLDELGSLRLIDPKVSSNVEIRGEAPEMNFDVDHLKDIVVSFQRFDLGDNRTHALELEYHTVTPEVDQSALAMLGCWTMKTDVTGDFSAKVTIYFNHPDHSPFDFEKLQLVAKHSEETGWETVDDANFFHLEADPARGKPLGINGVEFVVYESYDFAIVQGKPDLQIVKTHIFANPVVFGQWVWVRFTVRNVGTLATVAENVDVLVYYTDAEGTPTTIEVVSLGDIVPGKDEELTGEAIWKAPYGYDWHKETYYIYFRVDPNGNISEYNEKNNVAFVDELRDGDADPIEVVHGGCGPIPSFASTMTMMILSAFGVVSLAVVQRRKRKANEPEGGNDFCKSDIL